MKAGSVPSRGPARGLLNGRYAFLVVFGLALATRLLFIVLRDSVGLSEPANPDSIGFQEQARSVLAGTAYGSGPHSGLVAETFFAPPLYPYFLAGIYALSGSSAQMVLVVQAVIGAVTAVFIAGMAGRLFGPKALLAAGLLAATQPYLIMQTAEFMTEPLFMFLYSASLLLCVVALTRTDDGALCRRWDNADLAMTGSGALLGAAMLCRPSPLPGLPVLFLSLVLVKRGCPFRARLFQAALFAVAAILVMSPWVLRTYSLCHAWVPVACTAEFTLYIGNAPGWADAVFLREEVAQGTRSMDDYFAMLGEHTPGWFARRALAAIGRDPHRFLRLSLARAKLWFKVLPERRGPPVRWALALWHYSVLFPLGVLGLAYSLRRRGSFAWVLLPFLLTMCLVHICALPNMRYRVVLVDAVLLVFISGLLVGPAEGVACRLRQVCRRSVLSTYRHRRGCGGEALCCEHGPSSRATGVTLFLLVLTAVS